MNPVPMQILHFPSAAKFRNWLHENHAVCDGFWLRISKKGSGEASVTYAEALDQALCYGWIDGLKKSHDERSWIQKFTPRRARSGWSKLNTQHVARLHEAGLMMPAGVAAVEAAKADGRWAAAYSSPRNATVPEDFLKALGKHKKALAFFQTLSKANLYGIVYLLETAKKPETRARRMQNLIVKMKAGTALHPAKSDVKKSKQKTK